MATKPSIVFAHGLWADGSCFSKLIPTLQAEGHEVIAAQNSLDSLKGDVEAVQRTLGRVSSPAILVGSLLRRNVITAAGTDERVVGLVYICALAPDADETSQTQQSKFPKTDVFCHIEVVDGRVWLRPEWHAFFSGDFPEQEQRLVWATQGAPARTYSTRNLKEPHGSRNRAGISSAKTTTPCTPIWSALLRSAWAQPPMSSTAATCRCSPARTRARCNSRRRKRLTDRR